MNKTKLSSEDSGSSSDSLDDRRGQRVPPLPKLPNFEGKQPDWQVFLFQFWELVRTGKWYTRENHDWLLACPKSESSGTHPESPQVGMAGLLHPM